MRTDRSVVADDGRWPATNRPSLDEDRGSVSSELFSLKEDPGQRFTVGCQRSTIRRQRFAVGCQRSTVRRQRTTVRFVVDEVRALGSEAGAPAPAPRFLAETRPDFVPLTDSIGKGAIS
jgi:hypothetical protein